MQMARVTTTVQFPTNKTNEGRFSSEENIQSESETEVIGNHSEKICPTG